jgi:hypothetical protein
MCCVTDRFDFGMRRWIPFGLQFVRSASDDQTIANDDHSNRTIAPIASFAAKFEDFVHDEIVPFGVGISHRGKTPLQIPSRLATAA